MLRAKIPTLLLISGEKTLSVVRIAILFMLFFSPVIPIPNQNNKLYLLVTVLIFINRELLEAKDAYGRTPLHCCAISGSEGVLRLLLSSGSDATALDDELHSAVHWATGV